MRFLAAAGLTGLLAAHHAAGAELRVGPGQQFAAPSAAIAAAAAGDTILIAAGEYFDCSVIAQDRLTIAGDRASGGAGVVMTDKTCQGKAILVTAGADIVIRDLTLTRARVPDGNGAGIRAEGYGLTVERVRFVDNEDGLLAGAIPGSTIRILDSDFEGNGRCAAACAHAVYVGQIGLLHIEDSRFSGTREGHDIKSRAARTELIGNTFADGAAGSASYLVDLPNGGDLEMNGNRLEKGAHASDMRTAIMLGDETGGPADAKQVIARNTFADNTGSKPAFVVNWGNAAPIVSENILPAGTDALSRDGVFLHQVKANLYAMKVFVHDMIALAKRTVHRVISLV